MDLQEGAALTFCFFWVKPKEERKSRLSLPGGRYLQQALD